ncbi:MAG TPA: LuxR C-terminal-related transcriptional regulator [Candidatus Limnocylindria bacterium]|jgi:DNA-binding CsgD family transcriptional regulator
MSAPIDMERRGMTLLSPLPLRRNRRADDGRGRAADPALTPRQREVLDLLVRGLTNKEIGGKLGIGADAVKRVISRLLTKLDAPSRTALVQQALQTSVARNRSRGPNALGLLEAAPIPAVVTRGAAHQIEYANAAAKRVLPGASAGSRLTDLLPSASRRTVERMANECLAARAERVARDLPLNDFTRLGTSWRRADLFASPIYDGADRVAGLVVFFVDVSNDPRPVAGPAADSPSEHRARPA